MNARQMFKDKFGNSLNFMSTDVLYRRKLSPMVAVELSTGRFMDADVFGVTVLADIGSPGTAGNPSGLVSVHPWNRPFATREAAEAFVASLGKPTVADVREANHSRQERVYERVVGSVQRAWVVSGV